MWVLCLVIVLFFSTLCPSSFTFILMGKIELPRLLYCNCLPDVLLLLCIALPHGGVGWSAVYMCDCGISRFYSLVFMSGFKVSKSAKIKNQYYQVPHLTQDTNVKVIISKLFTTNESREVSPFQQVTIRYK